MPVMIPNGHPLSPPASTQLGQTSLSTVKSLNQFPPPATLKQSAGSLMNGQDYMNIRPPMPVSLPPTSRPVQKQHVPLSVSQVSTTSDTPSKSTGAFIHPMQDHFLAPSVAQQVQHSTAFSSLSQKLPSGPRFPPGLLRPPLVSQQHLQPPLLQGQKTPQETSLSPFASGQQTGLSPITNNQPGMLPQSVSNISSYPQPPVSSTSEVFLSHATSGISGYCPLSPAAPGIYLPSVAMYRGYPPPPGTAGYVPFACSSGQVPPPALSGATSLPPFSNDTGSRPAVAALQYKLQSLAGISSVPSHNQLYHYGQPGPEHPVIGAYPNTVNAMAQSFDQMGIHDSQRVVNLLTERHLIHPDGIEIVKPSLSQNFKNIICSPEVFRCTLNAVPQSSALLSKARLPLGILIHPFKDLSQLPVIQSSIIVRCRSCKSYINPFVAFVDQRKWKCNMCYHANNLPDEFSLDPVSKTYGDPQRRPELRSASIEFIAPSEYMLRPPQPAVYLFLLDVSFSAVETGYLSYLCQVLLDEIDELPGDGRTAIGFLCYDSRLYYFNLAEGLSQPQMLCVPDLEEPFLPSPDSLLVNLHESKELVADLLTKLPNLFVGNCDTGSALGAALQSAHKLLSPTGGRITVMQTCLPTVGPGALQNSEDGNTPGKSVTSVGPATDFYKKLSLDCSAQQIAVDLFMLNDQYADLATLSCISKYSAGCIYYYPSFHTMKNPGLVDKYSTDLRMYLTRKIGFESVMRIRCTRGLSIHTFHGNFFVRSTDLLSLPNINPDTAFGMQMSIEKSLVESSTVSFQAALLYTSSKGERRIRVHTLCLPVTDQLSEVFTSADQLAIAALLAKMAVERCFNSSISDARESLINASLNVLMTFGQQIPASQRVGALLVPYSLRLIPMLMLTMLKYLAFSLIGDTKVDDRVFAMQQCKVLPVCFLIQRFLPHLYPLHKLSKIVQNDKEEIPSAPLLPLSSASIDHSGLFLLDTGEAMYLLVGSEIENQMCQDIFGKPDFVSIPDDMMNLPKLENSTSGSIRCFINHLRDSKPHGTTFLIIRDDSEHRYLFFQYLLEDKTENSMSYFEFLQYLQGKAKY